MRQATTRLTVATSGPGFIDLTVKVRHWLDKLAAGDGLLTAYCRHTSASLVIQENADSDVRRDLIDALDRLAPRSARYRHDVEGQDDMPAHIKAAITSTSISIPVIDGAPVFGAWQALYLVEHRDAPHEREVVLHFIGDVAAD
jgi:secondary thiamine-phosphate synthase enzyme